MRLALFQEIGGSNQLIHTPEWDCDFRYVRISAYVDVLFPPLEPEAVAVQLAYLDAVAGRHRETFEEETQIIEQQRSTLIDNK